MLWPAGLCPRWVWAPQGRHGRGAAVRRPGSALIPAVAVPGLGSLPAARAHPPSALWAPLPDLSLFPSHIFRVSTPFPFPPRSSFCTSSGSFLVLPAPRAETRTLGHLFSSTVGFSVLIAHPSLSGETHTHSSAFFFGGGGGAESELKSLPPPHPARAPLGAPSFADGGITSLGGIRQVSWGVCVFSLTGSCRNVPINTLHLQGFVHFPTETPQREGWLADRGGNKSPIKLTFAKGYH